MKRIHTWAVLTVVFAVSTAGAALPEFDTGIAFETLEKGARELPSTEGAEKYDASYYEVDPASVKTVKLEDSYSPLGEIDLPVIMPVPGGGKPLPNLPGPQPGVGSGGGTIDTKQIINIAEKIWEFIENNKPVVNATNHYANAVPDGIKHWTELEGWAKPSHTLYSFSAKNKAGAKVIDVTYMVLRTTGGSKGGKGKFLTGATVLPLSITALWGYKFDMGVDVPSVSNVGTAEEPVAAMTMNLTWKIKNNFKVMQGAGVYYLQGDGHFEQLAGPFESK